MHKRLWAAICAAAMLGGLGATVAPAQAAEDSNIVFNEVESNGDATDWAEVTNIGSEPIDISGWIFKDNADKNPYTLPAGSIVNPGEFLVIDGEREADDGGFLFGLGASDAVRLFNGETLVASFEWAGGHAATTFGRCPDGTGEFTTTASSTKGAANDCAVPVVINEIESQAGSPDDWVELMNTSATDYDASGLVITDNAPSDPTHRYQLPAGSIIPAGGFLVVDVGGAIFGLGGADSVNLYDTDGTTLLDSHSWTAHSPTTLARCPDGIGGFVDSANPTKGEANDCLPPVIPDVVINEVNSNSAPGDYIELFNNGDAAVDLSGYFIRDDNDTRTDRIKAGTIIEPKGFLLLSEGPDFSFGLGNGDKARLFLPDGLTLVDEYVYATHGVPSWGRCPDGVGEWTQPETVTPGYGNCGGTPPPAPEPLPAWPGSQDTSVVDTSPIFLDDSSGLDFTMEGDQGILWAVDNGTGIFWKLNAAPDGTVAFATGWEQGKRARFIADAGNPAAAGPDAEGITIANDGFVYIGVERNNSDKSINYNVVLKVDPNAPGPDVVASQEWDLTASLPQVTANTGIEAIEWVADTDLAGLLWDDNTEAPYDPAGYPGHGDGLFFVAVEDNGGVYSYALNSDGSFQQVAFIDPGLPGVMALDWDSVRGGMWAKCDNGCENTAAFITLNATKLAGETLAAQDDDSPIVTYAAPTGLPNDNFEGFATASISYCIDGERPVWWFVDGLKPAALRSGTLPCQTPVLPIATLEVNPTSWLDSQEVTLTGNGFDAGEVVVITSTLPNGTEVEVARATADATGTFTWVGVLPIDGLGQYTIRATGQTSERWVGFSYTRNPREEGPTPTPPATPPSKPNALPKTGVEGQGTWLLLGVLVTAGIAAARSRR